jgi:hypothetical protein
MLIKKLFKMSAIAAMLLSLAACSTADKSELGETSASPTQADNALTQGAGDVGSFYGDESTHPMQVIKPIILILIKVSSVMKINLRCKYRRIT